MASRDDDLMDPNSTGRSSLFSEADSAFKTWKDVSPESSETLSDEWKGRDPSQSMNDRKTRYFKQYENDIFFIHDSEDPESSHIVIRESTIGAHVKAGKIGIKMSDNGAISIQGNPIFTASGLQITKGIFTENPLSYIVGQPAYLPAFPKVDMVKDIQSLFEKFCEFFKGAPSAGNPLP